MEDILLGAIQGVVEWLPVSSEGAILLTKKVILQSDASFQELIRYALFLHLGTFLAALIYFFPDVKMLCSTLMRYSKHGVEDQKVFSFLLLTTVISGCVGLSLIHVVELETGLRVSRSQGKRSIKSSV